MMPAMNFAVALSTFVGQNIAVKKMERIRKGLISTLWLSMGLTLAVTVVILIFGKDMMRMFTDNQEVIGIGAQYLTVVAMFYWVFTAMFTINGLLRGAGATMVPMLTTLVSLWAVRVPAAYILAKWIGVSGIWLSIPIGWAVGLVGAYAYYRTGKWKNKTVFDSKGRGNAAEAMMGEMEV